MDHAVSDAGAASAAGRGDTSPPTSEGRSTSGGTGEHSPVLKSGLGLPDSSSPGVRLEAKLTSPNLQLYSGAHVDD